MTSHVAMKRRMKKQRDAKEYLEEKMIPQLFQSLTMGLVVNRPDDELTFLRGCLDTVSVIGWQNVKVDSFLHGEQSHSDSVACNSNIPEVFPMLSTAAGPAGVIPSCDTPEVNFPPAPLSNRSTEWFQLMQGSFRDLPPMPSSTVRIFISSTFSDYKAERNALLRHAFPALQRFCTERGLDFQVVDLRWGVTDEVINDHQVSSICLKEIETCKRLSVGPHFVALLGDRYGYRPFPSCIAAAEFDILMSTAAESLIDVGVMKEWYVRDGNAIPPNYVLLPLAIKLPYYNNMDEAYSVQQRADRKTWDTVSQTIHRTLRSAATKAVSVGLMDASSADKYFISVTEDEIRHGAFDADPLQTIGCIRSLAGIDNATITQTLGKFLDISNAGTIDSESTSLLAGLKSKLTEKSDPENMFYYETQWNDISLEEDMERHQDYLEKFCADFTHRMKSLIDFGLQKEKNRYQLGLDRELALEVLHHAQMAETKRKIFCGREETLGRIREYFVQDRAIRHPPLVLHGLSGQGKTALMAVASSRTSEWLGSSCRTFLILRFLGTSPASSDVFCLLRNVLSQLSVIFQVDLDSKKLEKMSDVRNEFWNLLEEVGKKNLDSCLVLYFDSVDQFSENYAGHQMAWLPRHLPGNVFIVVSMLTSDCHKCLENTRKRIDSTGDMWNIELEPLGSSAVNDVIDLYLRNTSRKLTENQLKLVRDVFSRCSQPLFIKLVLDQAVCWASFTQVGICDLPRDVHSAISRLFEVTETKYGVVFVSHALALLTCSHGGLTAVEMEDALSCDDDVLNEVYHYHDPPLEGIIRIPCLMWARLEEDLREYLTERQVDGKSVLSWYHRQFWETAEQRYLFPPDRQMSFHHRMSEIYGQEDGIQRSITLLQRHGKVIENADRKITPQPLSATNLRKLKCLPFHLFHSRDVEQLKEKCLVSFAWVLTWLRAEGIYVVVNDFRSLAESELLVHDVDVNLVSNFLQLCYDSLHYNVELFAFHVVERIPADHPSDAVRRFVDNAKCHISSSVVPQLLPTHSMGFPDISSPLQSTVMVGQEGVLTKDESKVVCMWVGTSGGDLRIQVLNLTTLDTLASVRIPKPSPFAVTQDGQYFIYVSGLKVQICETETGDLHREIQLCDERYNIMPRCIAISHNGQYVVVATRQTIPPSPNQSSFSGTLVMTFDLSNLDHPLSERQIVQQKAVNKVYFTPDDGRLLAVWTSLIFVLSFPDLKVLYQTCDNYGHIFPDIMFPIPSTEKFILASGVKGGAKAFLFDAQDFSTTWSPLAKAEGNIPEDETLIPFGVAFKANSDTLLFGTRMQETKKKIGCGSLWLWNGVDEQMDKIPLGVGKWKFPTSLFAPSDWQRVVIGWNNGDLSIVNLPTRQEVWSIHAHSRMVNSMWMCRAGEILLTLAADNYLKIWNTNRLSAGVESRTLLGKMVAEFIPTTLTDERENFKSWISTPVEFPVNGEVEPSTAKNPESMTEVNSSQHQVCNTISPEEQCVDTMAFHSYLVTAPHVNEEGPKFWHLANGKFDAETTSSFDHQYKRSLAEHGISFGGRNHAEIYHVGNYIIYCRKLATSATIYVASVINGNVTTVSHEQLFDTYITYIDKPLLNDDIFTIFLVREGTLEHRDMRLQLLDSFEIPKMTESIENMMSNSGKKRLISYKAAITKDRRYFIVVNPTPGGKHGRYIDLVDLTSKSFVGRMPLDNVPWKVLDDAVYFLTKSSDHQHHELVSMRNMEKAGKLKYSSLVFTSNEVLSPDGGLGVELAENHVIHVWDCMAVNSEPICSLTGHVAEVNCVSWSLNGRRLIVSGSSDNTVRLWSLDDGGYQLCLFHVYGVVHNVHFDRSSKYVVVHCNYAPQRKRAAILEIC